MDLQPIEQTAPDLMQWFLLLALFLFCWLAISQTKVINLVYNLASIPQSNVRNYTSANFPQTHTIIFPLSHFGGADF